MKSEKKLSELGMVRLWANLLKLVVCGWNTRDEGVTENGNDSSPTERAGYEYVLERKVVGERCVTEARQVWLISLALYEGRVSGHY